MPPFRQPSPFAARSLVIGALAAAAWWHWRGPADASAWSLLTGGVTISEGSGAMFAELMPRMWRTLVLVLSSAVVATFTGLLLAMITAPLGCRMNQALSWPGLALASMPVVGLGWLSIATLVNELKLPIESLIPYTPPPDRDSTLLVVGRVLWSWLVPMWVIVVPLCGAWFAEISVALATARLMKNSTAVRARGLRGRILSVHLLSIAWAHVQNRWLHLVIGALAWSVWVEDLFGLPGWGGYLASSVKSGRTADIAAGLYAMAFIVAALSMIGWIVRRVTRVSLISDHVARDVVNAPPRTMAGSISVFAVLIMALIAATCVQPQAPAWMTQWLLPWLTSLLPEAWQGWVRELAPPALTDLHQAGVAAAWAALTTIVLGSVLAAAKRWRPISLWECVDVFAFGPVLVYALVLGTPKAMGCALGVATACRWRDLSIALLQCDYAQAAKVVGVPWWSRGWRYLAQPLLHSLAAWTLRHCATAMLWIVLITNLHGGKGGLGERLEAVRSTVLAQPESALWPTVVAATIILALRALARFVRTDEEDASAYLEG